VWMNPAIAAEDTQGGVNRNHVSPTNSTKVVKVKYTGGGACMWARGQLLGRLIYMVLQ
jgi:hypothetical protein